MDQNGLKEKDGFNIAAPQNRVEIYQYLDAVVCPDPDILRLQVPVDHPGTVHALDPGDELSHHFPCLSEAENGASKRS